MTTKDIQEKVAALESRRDAAQQELSEVRAGITSMLLDGGDPGKLQAKAAGLQSLIDAMPAALEQLEEHRARAQAAEDLAALRPELERARKLTAAAQSASEAFFDMTRRAMEGAFAAAAAITAASGSPDREGIFFRLFSAIGPVGYGQNPRAAFEAMSREIRQVVPGEASRRLQELEQRAKLLSRAAAETEGEVHV